MHDLFTIGSKGENSEGPIFLLPTVYCYRCKQTARAFSLLRIIDSIHSHVKYLALLCDYIWNAWSLHLLFVMTDDIWSAWSFHLLWWMISEEHEVCIFFSLWMLSKVHKVCMYCFVSEWSGLDIYICFFWESGYFIWVKYLSN